MDFDQLHTFLEIVRLNSFSKAAKTCYRTQPAISAQIRQMEQELGTQLFDRFGSRITLTVAGRTFAEYARNILDLRRQGFDAVRELEHVAKGEMSIAANEATCIHVLPGVFARYKEQFPEVRIQVVRAYGADTIESVVDNSVDFGVTQLPLQEKKLEVVQIYSDEIRLMTGANHRLARKKTIGPEEIVEEDLLLPKAGRTRTRINEYLDPYEDRVRISMELESSEMQKRFTEAGLGGDLHGGDKRPRRARLWPSEGHPAAAAADDPNDRAHLPQGQGVIAGIPGVHQASKRVRGQDRPGAAGL